MSIITEDQPIKVQEKVLKVEREGIRIPTTNSIMTRTGASFHQQKQHSEAIRDLMQRQDLTKTYYKSIEAMVN